MKTCWSTLSKIQPNTLLITIYKYYYFRHHTLWSTKKVLNIQYIQSITEVIYKVSSHFHLYHILLDYSVQVIFSKCFHIHFPLSQLILHTVSLRPATMIQEVAACLYHTCLYLLILHSLSSTSGLQNVTRVCQYQNFRQHLKAPFFPPTWSCCCWCNRLDGERDHFDHLI